MESLSIDIMSLLNELSNNSYNVEESKLIIQKIQDNFLLYKQHVYNICSHEMETDFIDITPDKSKMISYCRICGFTEDK